MSTWKIVLTLTAAVLMVAAPVFAQSSSDGANTTAPQMPGAKQPDSGAKSDTTAPSASPPTSSSPSAPGASPGTTTDTTKKDTMKSDTMKRDRRMAGGGDREQVKAAQQALKDKGHDPGAVDGVMGPKTRAAVRDFQKKEGMKDTGRLDQETMGKLGVEGTKTSAAPAAPGAASPATGAPSDKPADSAKPSDSGSMPGSAAPAEKKNDSSSTDKR